MRVTEERSGERGQRLAALIAALCLAGCSASQQVGSPSQLASPASQYCATEGGKRVVERAVDGDIGVCVFAGSRQCEEGALLRGDCPRGGIPVSGYATTSERHCAIRGARMTIPGCALSPAGLYESSVATLTLGAGRVAMVIMGSSGGTSRYLAPGNWESSGTVVMVSTEDERLVFDYAGDRLVAREWDRRIWGAAGPGTLMRKR
jgi:putative hemolysin